MSTVGPVIKEVAKLAAVAAESGKSAKKGKGKEKDPPTVGYHIDALFYCSLNSRIQLFIYVLFYSRHIIIIDFFAFSLVIDFLLAFES